jgi:hypothetical protein
MKNIYLQKLFFATLLLFCEIKSNAQDFGDSWINFDQTYYKIPVAREGIYKITPEFLQKNKVGPEFFASNSQLQIWHRGVQQAITVVSSGDSLKTGDYILFYGTKNDGTQDAQLYFPKTDFYNQHTNLFSDTTAYFLTLSKKSTSKRVPTLNSSNFENSTDYFIKDSIQNSFEFYWNLGYEGSHPTQTLFTPSEGWCSFGFTNKDFSIPIKNYIDQDSLNIEVYLTGKEQNIFQPEVYLIGKNKSDTLNFPVKIEATNNAETSNYGALKTKISLSASELAPFIDNEKLNLKIKNPANISFNYVHFSYSKLANLKSLNKTTFRTSNFASQAIRISNTPYNANFAIVTDKNSISWISFKIKNDTAFLPNLPKSSKVFYTTEFEEINTILPVEFKEYIPTDSTFLIITHKKLWSSAQAYADYRQSLAGGGYDVLIAEIGQLTNQYSYGERTPLAIRRFLNQLKSKNINSPDQLFIIGMGIQLDYMQRERNNESFGDDDGDMVLPAGCPGGDFVYSSGLDGTIQSNSYNNLRTQYPTVSTGRISAKTNQDVLNYLSKAKEHDALNSSATWRRNVLHITGGFQSYQTIEYNLYQSKLFRTYMFGANEIIKLPYFGANLTTLGRYQGGATELIDVSKEVNDGVSLITFLGHSSRQITDVTIGFVSNNSAFNYRNKGKYPVLYLNGCVIGNTFYNPTTTGEPSFILDWILTKDRGAIAALSNSGTGFLSELRTNIEDTYKNAFLDSITFGKTIGEQIIASQKTIYTGLPKPNENMVSLLENTSIQGDPAIHIFNAPKPDYESICDRISLRSNDNKKITNATNSFEILIPVKNYGMHIRGNVSVSVKRSYLNNTKSIQYPLVSFGSVRDFDTLRFKIDGAIQDASGANTFEIRIDPENVISEMNEGNNTCNFTTYIPGNSLICLYPKKYSVVSKRPVTFIAESYTVSTAARDYYFELDTNYRFNSPFKRSFQTTAFNLPQWHDQQLLSDDIINDSIVYYWRVKYLKPQQNEDTSYSYSSFIYIKNSPNGWSQSEYPQFFEDDKRAIKLDSNTGLWDFQKLSAPLKFSTTGIGITEASRLSNLTFKNIPQIYNGICAVDGLYLYTINPQDLTVRWVKPTQQGNERDVFYVCNEYSSLYVTRFWNALKPNKQIHEVLKEKVNHGEIIALMSIGKANFPLPDSLNEVLKTYYGASNDIDSLKDGQPYLLLARKGFGKLKEKLPTKNVFNETLTIDTTIYSLGYGGYVSSTLIGPSSEWGNYFREYRKSANDSIRFDIVGIDSLGNESVVVPDIKEDNVSLKEMINADRFPFLKLNAYKETNTAFTPQLKRWQVIFRPVPEGSIMINEKSASEYATFSRQEGDTAKTLHFVFKNISTEAFKPNLLVRYRIIGNQRITDYYDTLRTSLTPDSSWVSTFKVNTNGLAGNNTLEVFFNPTPGQKEELADNNRFSINFTISQDKIHPILEVAFDGQRIMNGDIVSPNPTISIAVNDENKYQIRQDTTGITVELQRPCGQPNCPFERIYLGGNDISIFPAGANNKFELRFKPEKLPDGVYTLRVQAKDVSGNLSGVKPYTIQFEVVNEVAITNFLPYPNPFSSRMWFVYTLTGDLPDQIRIQILTITGKVVKQIFMEELGPLKIGTHKTDFIWDGTDDYGDQLANGLYIYKVSARKNGEELKHRNTVADNLFKNGYGKLYILR